jgi:hypothetical protein
MASIKINNGKECIHSDVVLGRYFLKQRCLTRAFGFVSYKKGQENQGLVSVLADIWRGVSADIGMRPAGGFTALNNFLKAF